MAAGPEVLCLVTGGLDVSGHEETDPRVIAAEEWARAVMTERGSAFWDPSFGLGLHRLMNTDLTKAQRDRIPMDVRAEGMRTGLLRSAKVTMTYEGRRLVVTCDGATDQGLFSLVLGPGDARRVLLL